MDFKTFFFCPCVNVECSSLYLALNTLTAYSRCMLSQRHTSTVFWVQEINVLLFFSVLLFHMASLISTGTKTKQKYNCVLCPYLKLKAFVSVYTFLCFCKCSVQQLSGEMKIGVIRASCFMWASAKKLLKE